MKLFGPAHHVSLFLTSQARRLCKASLVYPSRPARSLHCCSLVRVLLIACSLDVITEKDEVPDLMIKLSLWMSDSFTFAVYSKPAQDVLQQMQIAKLPQLQLMVPQPVEGDEGAVSFGASPYDRKMFGAMKFNNLLRFFAAAQMELRKAGLIREPDEAPVSFLMFDA